MPLSRAATRGWRAPSPLAATTNAWRAAALPSGTTVRACPQNLFPCLATFLSMFISLFPPTKHCHLRSLHPPDSSGSRYPTCTSNVQPCIYFPFCRVCNVGHAALQQQEQCAQPCHSLQSWSLRKWLFSEREISLGGKPNCDPLCTAGAHACFSQCCLTVYKFTGTSLQQQKC